MISLFGHEGIKAWCNGRRVIWLGIRVIVPDPNINASITNNDAVVNNEDGTIGFESLANIVTEWQWDEKRQRWADVSESPEDDDE